jgi:hypothetical protein
MMPKRLPVALAAALVAMALAGCTAGSDDPTDGLDDLGADGGPTLYMNVTANGETHRFSSKDLPGIGGGDDGDDEGDDGSDVDANATSSSGTVTASGNATAGNGTAQGNATASNGTATGSAGGGPAGGGTPGVPSGDAPLDVVVELGASGLPEDELVNWTVRWGDAASATVGNGSAQGSANGTAARQQAQESGSSLPMRLQHTYGAAGRYDLSFAVTVAGQAIDTLRTVVAAGEGSASMPSGTPLGNETKQFTGSFAFSDPLCEIGGSEEFEWPFNGTFNGTPSQVQRILVTAEAEGVADLTLTLVDGNGTELASGPQLDETGPFPPGAYKLVAESCGSANASFVVTAVQEHVST